MSVSSVQRRLVENELHRHVAADDPVGLALVWSVYDDHLDVIAIEQLARHHNASKCLTWLHDTLVTSTNLTKLFE